MFSGRNRQKKPGARPNFEFFKDRRVGTYFYILDPDFGPSFVKLCTYCPWPGKVWLNGHEWVRRQALRAGIGYTELENGFAAARNANGCRRSATASRPSTCRRSSSAGSPPSRRRCGPRTARPGTGGICRCARQRSRARWCSTPPAAPERSSRRSFRTTSRDQVELGARGPARVSEVIGAAQRLPR